MAAEAAALLAAPLGGVAAVGEFYHSIVSLRPSVLQSCSCTRAFGVWLWWCVRLVVDFRGLELEDVLRSDFRVEGTGVEFSVPLRSVRVPLFISYFGSTPCFSFGFLLVEIILFNFYLIFVGVRCV